MALSGRPERSALSSMSSSKASEDLTVFLHECRGEDGKLFRDFAVTLFLIIIQHGAAADEAAIGVIKQGVFLEVLNPALRAGRKWL